MKWNIRGTKAMTPKQVLCQLLEIDEYSKNITLLKKIMLTTYIGRLRINDQPPDRRFSLRGYLFDDERIIFDFTRLSDTQCYKFKKWLLEEHKNQKTTVMLSSVGTNEYRGFTAEVALSWWGQLLNWLFNTVQDQWQLADFAISIDYQLMGLEICEGKRGLLIGFQQLLTPTNSNKYHDPAEIQLEPIGNTKRVYLTNAVIDKLINSPLDDLDFVKMYDKPHPQSVRVKNLNSRYKAMHEYRQIQQFNYKPWYIALMDWCLSWFVTDEKSPPAFINEENPSEVLLETEGVSIYKRINTDEIIVVEPRPELDIMVYCGGGAKMFAHVGVMKALNEEHIRPSRFSGSSAGAFIALMSYLGYKADEVLVFLKLFKQENLIHYDIDRNGLSNSTGLKAAVDFMIAKKVEQITAQYKIPHPQGLITFATLDGLRERCPDCGIGNELVVTATNLRESQTRYFSLIRTPNKEVSEVVTASASIPLVYRPMLIEGEEHSDGGILNNFPTEAFCDDNSTFLEAENGNNLKLLAVQFDNGTERLTIDKIMERVYKENAVLNGFYRLVTGINDPASGWEQDRIKLRQHALQSVIVNVGDVVATEFNLTEQGKCNLVQNGYSATKKYIQTRYVANAQGAENDELMYSTFTSLGDLLSYCCYRNQKIWFDRVYALIKQGNNEDTVALLAQADILRLLYFNDAAKEKSYCPAFFGRTLSTGGPVNLNKENYDYFRALYPLCLVMTHEHLLLKGSKALFEKTRHAFGLQSPLYSFGADLAKIPGKKHILFHLTVIILQELNADNRSEFYAIIQDLTAVFNHNPRLMHPQFFGDWNLTLDESMQFLHLFKTKNIKSAQDWCASLQAKDNLVVEKTIIEPVNKTDMMACLLGRVML